MTSVMLPSVALSTEANSSDYSLTSATPGNKAGESRLRKCKSLTWDACTWNSDLLFPANVTTASPPQQKAWTSAALKAIDLNLGSSKPSNSNSMTGVGCSTGENTKQDQGQENVAPSARKLVRRATFCNFPKNLSGDHFHRGGQDHMRLRHEAGAGDLPPQSDEVPSNQRRLRRVDSAELVRKAFKPGILYGVGPNEEHCDVSSDDEDVVVLDRNDNFTENDAYLPAPPPVSLEVPQQNNDCPQNMNHSPLPNNLPAYGQEMPMVSPPPGMPPNPYYLQAMQNHLLYCLQVQQQMQQMMFANSMIAPDPMQFMQAGYPMQAPILSPQGQPQQDYFQYPSERDNSNDPAASNKRNRRNRSDKSNRKDARLLTRSANGEYVSEGHVASACPLLSEYKSTGRKPSVQELRGNVVDFAKDSSGSRYLQYIMELCTAAEQEQIVEECIECSVELMEDLFGNYVMQNFLDHCTVDQRCRIISYMPGIVLMLSTQQHGCRVVQKALDLASTELRNKLLTELILPSNNISHCARDQNATHVLQKAVELLQADIYPHLAKKLNRPSPTANNELSKKLLETIEVAVTKEVMVLAVNPNACRLVQRVLADCSKERSPNVKIMMCQIEKEYPALAVDQHGNFILQHILEAGQLHQSNAIQDYVSKRVIELSQHKFGSHLVEKALTTGSKEQSRELISQILEASKTFEQEHGSNENENNSNNRGYSSDGSVLLKMMKDPYANFVLQRALDVSRDRQREALCKEIMKRTDLINQFTYGRHILSHIAKLQSSTHNGY